jgi:hypothetical protein
MTKLTHKNRKIVLRKIEQSLLRTPMGTGVLGNCLATPAQIRAAAKQILQRAISQQRKGLIAPQLTNELIEKVVSEARQGGAQ